MGGLFTPTFKSSFLAGITLNAILWSLLVKIKELSSIIRCDRWINDEIILGWINKHRLVSFSLAKFINLKMHGLNALGVSMCLGGSVIDGVMCFLVVPRMVKHKARARAVKTTI